MGEESVDLGQGAIWAKYMYAAALADKVGITMAPTTIVLEDND